MNDSIKTFLREEDGVTALEYGLLAAVIAGALIAGRSYVVEFFQDLFSMLSGLLDNANATPGTGTGS